ncbi:MAG: hypothetical protein PUE71_06140 [Clostridia bacterium]|nr:hypothetical protein [Clostridia bacterium]
MRKRYMLGRTAMVVAAILWLVNMLMLIPKNDGAVAAFGANKTVYPNVRVSAEGTYGIVYLNKNAKEIILKDMADKIGINRYEITSMRENNTETTTLFQDGANGSVKCEIKTTETQSDDLSIQAKQEFFVSIDLINNAAYAQEYAGIIKEIFEQYDTRPEMSVNYYG